jgi:hypothetical protein
MRHGKFLAAKLADVAGATEGDTPAIAAQAITPYLQFIRAEDARCARTGLRLQEQAATVIGQFITPAFVTPQKASENQDVPIISLVPEKVLNGRSAKERLVAVNKR